MDRKDFIRKSLQLGAGSAGLFLLGEAPPACGETAAQSPEADACRKKQEFAQVWVQRLVENMDGQLDEPARLKLMEACGRACFRRTHGEAPPAKPQPGDLERALAQMTQYFGEECVRKEGNAIHLSYGSSGRCLCPLVEGGPPRLSRTYCQCSVGYLKEIFERAVGKPVEVTLVESLKQGGQACRFTVQV